MPWYLHSMDFLTTPNKLNGSTPVSGLSLGVCPSAILWAIRTVNIYSIKGVPCGGLRPHIIKKSLRGVNPSIAYKNTPPAIRWIFLIRRVITSRLGGMEGHQFWCSLPSLRVPMFGGPLSNRLLVEAPTTFLRAAFDSPDRCSSLRPAGAFEEPNPPPVNRTDWPQGREPAIPRDIDGCPCPYHGGKVL